MDIQYSVLLSIIIDDSGFTIYLNTQFQIPNDFEGNLLEMNDLFSQKMGTNPILASTWFWKANNHVEASVHDSELHYLAPSHAVGALQLH